MNAVGGQGVVEELSEDALVGLDELSVDAGDVDLAEVDRASVVVPYPVHGVDESLPVNVGLEHLHRVGGHPLAEVRVLPGGAGVEAVEQVDLRTDSEDGPEVFAGVDPDSLGDGVRRGVVAAPDGLHLNPKVRMPAGGPGFCPLPGLVVVLGGVGCGGALERDADGLEGKVLRRCGEVQPAAPPAAQRHDNLVGRRPLLRGHAWASGWAAWWIAAFCSRYSSMVRVVIREWISSGL